MWIYLHIYTHTYYKNIILEDKSDIKLDICTVFFSIVCRMCFLLSPIHNCPVLVEDSRSKWMWVWLNGLEKGVCFCEKQQIGGSGFLLLDNEFSLLWKGNREAIDFFVGQSVKNF
jgi:hypothetical protein